MKSVFAVIGVATVTAAAFCTGVGWALSACHKIGVFDRDNAVGKALDDMAELFVPSNMKQETNIGPLN